MEEEINMAIIALENHHIDSSAVSELLQKYKELEKNSIPISLIEKKIEDYKERKRYYEDENLVYDDEYYSYEIIIQVLQELLDERNNTDE